LWKAATWALREEASHAIDQWNEETYRENGDLTFVAEFPNTDEGWEQALDLADDLIEFF